MGHYNGRQEGDLVQCTKCGCFKPWTKYVFCTKHGTITMPCRDCHNREARERGAIPACEPSDRRPFFMRCADGQWRRIVRSFEKVEEDNQQ